MVLINISQFLETLDDIYIYINDYDFKFWLDYNDYTNQILHYRT